MKTAIIAIVILCFGAASQAQTISNKVIASGGKTKTAGNIMLEYTVGEPFVKTLSSANNKITQGFHQPTITVTRLMNGEEIPEATADVEERTTTGQSQNFESFKVEVFPNPATEYVKVRLEESSPSECYLFLSDASGKLINTMRLTETETTLDFTRIATGNYILVVKTADGTVNESFRVAKVN